MVKKKKLNASESFSKVIMIVILLFAALICLYPVLYVFSMSVSAGEHVLARDVYFWPRGFSLDGYRLAMENPAIWRGYYNTIWYTVIGTAFSLVMTILAAYPLSRVNFIFRRPVSILITITLFFSGGLIPWFITVSNLGLYNSRWGLIIPGAISTYNMIVARTFFEQIPDSLSEAATIDGANEWQILLRIILPLSNAILAVLALWYAVSQWNGYFVALILLRDPELQPLQLYLYRTLILGQSQTMGGIALNIARSAATEQLKYASIIITIVPILCIYPFLQKYFVKGVMIGAVKG
jgi:putative aldouronate transport system permease protein